jgi:hypothetical protein
LEEVLGKYYNEEKAAGRLQIQGGEEVDWVYLATPFVCCYARPVAVFLAFQKLMERISKSSPNHICDGADKKRIVPTSTVPAGIAIDIISISSAGIVCVF